VTGANPFDLTGRVAVVPGGSRGIGRGIAEGLADAGADVALWAQDGARAEATAAEIRKRGVKAIGLACDVSDEEQVRHACAATVDALGRIDAGFANAGFGDGYDPLKVSLERWRRLLAVNLDGVFLTLREVARHMVERGGGGKLVAISSITEIFGAPKQAGYAASKGAVGGLVRSLAIELARHDIQVNKTSPNTVLFMTHIGTTRGALAHLISSLAALADELDRDRRHRSHARARQARRDGAEADPRAALGAARRPGGHRGLPRVAGVGLPHRRHDPRRRRLLDLLTRLESVGAASNDFTGGDLPVDVDFEEAGSYPRRPTLAGEPCSSMAARWRETSRSRPTSA